MMKRAVEMKKGVGWAVAFGLMGSIVAADARVVINEIMYHAPADLEKLQFIELLNDSDQAVDLGGWSFTKGVAFQFPAGSKISPRGFVVVCADAKLFGEFYKTPAAGVFRGVLKKKGERIELSDAQGKVVDTVKYGSAAPWPASPDGFSSSLERISSGSSGDLPENWLSSRLSPDSV
ncbi:MAG: lamin tail domain-containing protein [Verrucomicrobia bacterium]|nr:lamin tail domain-containing protein [Verrucomicrobiota bacterium]